MNYEKMNEEHQFEYNTKKAPLKLKEYGRNIQMLVEYISKLDDKDKRTKYAYTLIALMKQLNPQVKENSSDSQQRIWDHLQVMANFDLDVESPYPMPDKDILHKPPRKMEYTQSYIKFRHYGKNLEMLANKALATDTHEEKIQGFAYIAHLMYTFYSTMSKDNIEEEVIKKNLDFLSKGEVSMNEVLEKYPDVFKGPRNPPASVSTKTTHSPSSSNKNKKKKKRKRRG